MDIGTGIAIAGIWGCVGLLGLSKSITSFGFMLGMLVATALTIFLK